VLESDSSFFFYFEPSREFVEKILNLRDEYGGAESGEWCIGGSFETFDFAEQKLPHWDFAYFLSKSRNIGCLLHIGEMRQVIFLSRDGDCIQTEKAL